jgi:hypothetical protein
MSHIDQVIQLVVVIAAGIAVVMQAIILLAIFLSLKKGLAALQSEVTELRAATIPVLRISQDFLTRVAPKIEATTVDVAELVHGIKDRVEKVESRTGVILERVERQTLRVDTLVTNALDTVEHAGLFVATAVNKPLRQVAGVVASIRAAVETMRSPRTVEPDGTYIPEEHEHSL